MRVVPAQKNDLEKIAEIYELIHREEEKGNTSTGWVRNIYPTLETAEEAFEKGELYAAYKDEKLVGSAVINHFQADSYKEGNWQYESEDEKIMVLHTLAVHPDYFRHGFGGEFIRFFEMFALCQGCTVLRMDTQAKNKNAREFYRRLGFEEAGIVPCSFNGIDSVDLVMLEKKL